MPACRYILTNLSLCLTVPAFGAMAAFGLLPALPALSQNAQTDINAATQTAPRTDHPAAPATIQATGTASPTSPPLWAAPADLIESETAAISPARTGETDILSCPFEALRAAYLALYDDTDALNVAALESEVYKICIERQKQVNQLLDIEERLRAQLGDLGDGTRHATSTVQARINAPTPETGIAEADSLDAAAIITSATEPPTPPADFREAKSAELAQSALSQCSDRYTSGPVFGSVTLDGGLHAFVFDATRGTRLTVKAGDTLPGGLTIARISTGEGVVISEQGVERQLARTLAAPAFDDGGGLLFTTVTLEDVYKLDSSQGSYAGSTEGVLE